MDPIRKAALRSPSAPALLSPTRGWDYGELDAAVSAAAQRFVDAGLRSGIDVALRCGADESGLIALFALWRIGVAPLLLHNGWTSVEIESALTSRGVDVWIDTGGSHESELDPTLRFQVRDGHSTLETSGSGGGRIAPRDSGTGLAAWLWTSGTSGPRVAIPVSWDNLAASARASRERLELGSEDGWYAALSPAHIGGLALVTRAHLLGSRLVSPGSSDANDLVARIRDGAVTHASLVPVLLRRFLDTWGDEPIPSTLCCVLVGGASCPRTDLERALQVGVPVALTYGLTEACSQVATAPPATVRRKPGCVGAPLGSVEVKISEDHEILVRGPTVTPGASGEDGWLHTGDLGRLDEEGELWVTGRRSGRIVSGGVTVDPDTVAEAIRETGEVSDVAVVGVPDPEWGERVVAVVVVDRRSAVESKDVREHIRRSLGATLSPAYRPKEVHFVSEIPRNANGKVDIHRVLAEIPTNSIE